MLAYKSSAQAQLERLWALPVQGQLVPFRLEHQPEAGVLAAGLYLCFLDGAEVCCAFPVASDQNSSGYLSCGGCLGAEEP